MTRKASISSKQAVWAFGLVSWISVSFYLPRIDGLTSMQKLILLVLHGCLTCQLCACCMGTYYYEKLVKTLCCETCRWLFLTRASSALKTPQKRRGMVNLQAYSSHPAYNI